MYNSQEIQGFGFGANIFGGSGGSGVSGYSGYSGYSGIGVSGYSGIGVSGYSGYSGISGYSGSVMYKVYVAIIAQSGTNAPTATVLENTLGEVPTYSRTGAGNYVITSPSSLFALNKTTLTISNSIGGNLNPVLSRVSTSAISLQSRTTSGVGVDDAFVGSYATTVEIRVYP
jgi:hypothetical protein